MSSTFRIEKLENRILLAGNITAIQNGSQLVINGDVDDNSISITNDGGAGTIDLAETDGGTVNGGGSSAQFTGITDIVVRGRAGDDIVIVSDIDIAGNLTVQLNNGDGFQATEIVDSSIGGNLAVSSDGTDETFVLITNNDIGGAARVVTGAGDDDLVFTNSAVGGQLVINGGHGDNSLAVGFGLDVGSNLVVLDASGDLNLDIEDAEVGGNLNINAGQGDNDIGLHDVDIDGRLRIETGDGDDFVHLCGIDVGSTSVVALRRGDDVLEVGDSNFTGLAQFSGGPHDGGDEYVDLSGNSFTAGPAVITRFELFGFGLSCEEMD